MSKEAMKLALDALEEPHPGVRTSFTDALTYREKVKQAITALREALAEQPEQEPCIKCKGLGYYDEGHECDDGSMAGGNYVECDKCKQPDFIKHEVENADDWSEWVCPDPKSYLMKCCDCGLVHEAQFRVAKYKPAPSDECEVVSDPDLQAQFRMRRSEQWSPADTAHRVGGLPMAEQLAQQEPVDSTQISKVWWDGEKLMAKPIPFVEFYKPAQRTWVGLTDEQIGQVMRDCDEGQEPQEFTLAFARAIEAKLKEKNT